MFFVIEGQPLPPIFLVAAVLSWHVVMDDRAREGWVRWMAGE